MKTFLFCDGFMKMDYLAILSSLSKRAGKESPTLGEPKKVTQEFPMSCFQGSPMGRDKVVHPHYEGGTRGGFRIN
jgi:hypothetical protein